MPTDDEPHVRIAVREYVDREVDRAMRHHRETQEQEIKAIERQFISVEDARKIALDTVNIHLAEMNKFREENQANARAFVRQDVHEKDMEKIEAMLAPIKRSTERMNGATELGRFTLERVMALAAIAVAIYAVLSR